MPVKKFSDGEYMVDPPYKFLYNNDGEILEEYQEQLIPKKKVKIRFKNDL